MHNILITEAGAAPTENIIKSFMECPKKEKIIGTGREPLSLIHSNAFRKYKIPHPLEPNYKTALLRLLKLERPKLAIFQNDVEVVVASKFRKEIEETETKLFMSRHEVLENCLDKYKSYKIWEEAGLKVPKSILINTEDDLALAFKKLGNEEGNIWIRATVGAGGKGALPTNNYEFAKLWIDRLNGWGKFMAAELLTSRSVTWLSIWYEGELVVAQTRRRKNWNFGNRTLSGVTGITGAAETYSDDTVNQVAIDTILAMDKRPHGVYGVDMTYDHQQFPNPTEINNRFFTTVHFFTKAGLNMPKIYKDIILYNEFPSLPKKINPLEDGLIWVRDMDREPLLTTEEKIMKHIIEIK